MRSASFSRREQARFCTETHVPKLSGDAGKSQIDVSFDIFEEQPFGPGVARDPRDMRPEMARVGFAQTLSRSGEWLARIARSDDVHEAAPVSAVEG